MPGFGPTAIIDVWEVGRSLDPMGRALAIWAATEARPGSDLADLPIGVRDADLLASRIATFGPTANGYAECPACTDALEFELDLAQFVLGTPDPHAVHSVDHDGWRVEFRLPTTTDVRAARVEADPHRALVERCIVGLAHHDVAHPAADLPAALDAVVDHAMRELDPQSDIEIKLACAACEHSWVSRFDIAHFYWREIEVEAGRLLAQVHVLARAYGWTEREVFELGPVRRKAYLDLVAAAR